MSSAVTDSDRARLDRFEAERRRLLGLAYRILGTFADAEDVVQEVWLRWSRTDLDRIDTHAAWLTTVTARLALDRLKSAQRRREHYIGPWLPEPVVTQPGPDEAIELSDTLTIGFLHLLEQLNPVERVVFLLGDVLGHPYRDVAVVVNRSEVACRQIASRARRRLHHSPPPRAPAASARRTASQLLAAVLNDDTDATLELLDTDVVLTSDGGPARRAARRPVVGPDRVGRFLRNLARRYADAGYALGPTTLNGDPGFVLKGPNRPELAVAFETVGGRVRSIWVVRNPSKLGNLDRPVDIA